MDMKELENIMISHGVVLRAIPKMVRSIYEKDHANDFPNGIIKYLEDFKREMLVVENVPENAGKFVFECEKNTSSTVRFLGKKFYDSIEQAVEDLVKMDKALETSNEKNMDKTISKIEEMLKKANKDADYCKGVEYDEGFYVGRGDALEDVLKLLKEKNKDKNNVQDKGFAN